MASGSTTLFVSNIPAGMDESEFEQIYTKYSGYQSCRVRKDKTNSIVGFVEFASHEQASRAMGLTQGHVAHEQALAVMFAKSQSKRPRGDDGSGPPRGGGKIPRQGDGDSSSGGGGGGSSSGSNGSRMGPPPAISDTLLVSGIPSDASMREVARKCPMQSCAL